MQRSLTGKRKLRMPHRIMVALALVLASVGFSVTTAPTSAQASTIQVCANSPVPADYVVLRVWTDQIRCGPYLRYEITNNITNGMKICAVTMPAHVGWVVVAVHQDQIRCGPYLYYTLSILSDGMKVCAVRIPPGWVVTSLYQDQIRCGPYLYYTIHVPTSGMHICAVTLPPGWLVTQVWQDSLRCSSYLRYQIVRA